MATYLVERPLTSGITTKGGVDRVLVVAQSTADAIACAKALKDGDSDSLWAAATATAIASPADMTGWRVHVKVTSPAGVDVADVTAEGGVSGVVSAAINAAGSGYSAGDILTVAGGTATRAATFRVTTIGGSGEVTGVELVDAGEYTVSPTLVGNAVTDTGAGTSATLDLTMGTQTRANFLAEVVGLLNATAAIAAASVDLGEAGIGSTDKTLIAAAIGDGIGDHQLVVEFLLPTSQSEKDVPIPSFVASITDGGIAAAVLKAVLAAGSNIVPSAPVGLTATS